MSAKKKLIIVLGPTAVGKTDRAIELAQFHSSPVISCDSRQLYEEMTIGTAVPSASQLSAVKHYFIQDHSIANLYTAGIYEIEALALIRRLFAEGHDTLIMSGGSMFYIDAVCNGLDNIPAADAELRATLSKRLQDEGVESLRMELLRLDPLAYNTIDIANPARVLRAVEVCLLSGKTFSSYKLAEPKGREFEIEKIGLLRPRDVLYDRINRRVIQMMEQGLLAEAQGLMGQRELTALQTVGYQELFRHLDNPDTYPLEKAITDIQTNTRHYAKRQLTWWRRDKTIKWQEL